MQKIKKKVVLIELHIEAGGEKINYVALVGVGKEILYKKRLLNTYYKEILSSPASCTFSSKYINEYVENLEFALTDKKFNLVDIQGLSGKKGEVIR